MYSGTENCDIFINWLCYLHRINVFIYYIVYFQISFHTSSDGFFKNIAKEIVPEDYGGSGPTVEILHS